MRLPVVLVLLAAALSASEIEDAARQLGSADPEVCKKGIEALVRLDSRRSLDVLIQALRAAHKKDAAKQRAYRTVLEKSTKELRKITLELEEALKTKPPYQEAMALSRKAMEVIATESEKVGRATREILPHLALLAEGTSALGEFKSGEAVARLEDLARHEPAGPVRGACLRALVGVSTVGMVPTLLALASDRDPRVRAIAVRALRRHIGEAGVVEQLEVAAEDKLWQVRRGAYLSLADGTPERVAPILEVARARETGDQLRLLDRLLHGMARGAEPPAASPAAFGLPVTSTRVRFVLDLSDAMKGRLDEVRTEMGRALDALPDGALFEIVGFAIGETSFASGPERATAASRERARQWMAKLRTAGPPDTTRLLDLLMPDYEAPSGGTRVFEALPDAVYLVFHEMEGEGAVIGLARFVLWNGACDAAFHARAFGEKYPDVMKTLAEGTGG
ncbi:MAG TPA: HEAT repeat domain-containing protein, partial [Planctomycetota bacterium]|nr:HEAT repeat domain-containing protein [Planctomycetota bacterium]